MPKAVINKDKCKGCLLCVAVCPKKTIIQADELNALGLKPAKTIKNEDCIGCAFCALICPECCIEIYKEK